MPPVTGAGLPRFWLEAMTNCSRIAKFVTKVPFPHHQALVSFLLPIPAPSFAYARSRSP